MIECVVNISEGRRGEVVEAIAATAGNDLLDVHVDADHNRSVLTLVGEDSVRAVAAEAVARLDLGPHEGVHPRAAFTSLAPDAGPGTPHPTAGAIAVGARPVLVAYNLWLVEPDLARARQLARSLRGPAVRALGLRVGEHVQVSMNLIDPTVVGPADVYASVSALSGVERAELVGLLPRAVLEAIDPSTWERLDLAQDRTIESRLEARARRAS